MAFIVADDVQDTTTTVGTISLTLSGTPPASYQSFFAGVGNSNTTCYAIRNGSDLECGIGTLTGGVTLSRDIVLFSTNGGAKVNWAAGTKYVYCTVSTKLLVMLAAALAGAGDAGKLVKVNAAGNGWDLVAQGTGGGLNADMVDGIHAAALMQLGVANNMTAAINEARGSNIASASTIAIGAAAGNSVDVTGSTTITAGDTVQAGAIRILRFTNNPAPQITHSGNLQMPGQVNFQARQYDQMGLMSYGGGVWVCIWIGRFDGTPAFMTAATTTTKGGVEQATTAEVASETANVFPDAASIKFHKGVAKTECTWNGIGTPAILQGYNMASLTDNGVGDYTLNMTSALASANYSPLTGTIAASVNATAIQCVVHGTMSGGPTTKTTTALRVNTCATTVYDMSQNYIAILDAA